MANDSPIYFWKPEEKEFGVFSQWYPSSFDSDIIKDGKKIRFQNAEQYMMYRKATHFNDLKIANEILRTSSPRKCKGLGQKVDNFTDSDWDQVKSQIVEEASYLKFTRSDGRGGEDLKKKLLQTENRELVEASPYDRVWGVGFTEKQLKHGVAVGAERANWGENRLGLALMVARERILREEEEKNKSVVGGEKAQDI